MAPAGDGEIALLEQRCAFGGDERIDARAVAITAINELLVLAQKHERGVIDGRERPKSFSYCHPGVSRDLQMRGAQGRH